ncbi:ABC transporter permease [Branchiibius sp. NY16-3462-2]|uniref:ABC transporter permease n=1 Tax=Branchiibius sp. NY16-3462-2 TaxID=1807500 RepID=UPI000795C595|nr:ABC transporter permease [Branchiibius sp. NY16-3462-2]KYH46162.1 ABC transporter [Branchiibius sp. NY16-3462-2]
MSTLEATKTGTLTAASTSGGGSALWHAVVLAKRSLIKTFRTPEALIDVTLQPIIFLAMFTYIFGGAIAGGSQHDYLQFLLPGILAQTIATASVSIGQNLNEDIEKGVFDRFRSLPIARSAPLVGTVLADVVRYLILFTVIMTVGSLMGFRVETNPLNLLAALVLSMAFALCFCWISVFVGMIARTPGSVQGIMFMLVLPLTFASSTFVAVNTMPGWLQAFVNVNPITHLVDVIRGLLLGTPMGDHLLWLVVWMVGLLVVFVPLALRAYRRRA